MPTSPETRYSPIITALGQPADLRSQPISTLHLVMGARLCALFERVDRDPLAEMAMRLGSVTAAEQIIVLMGTVGRCWPEPFVVSRPCCLAMTPDERTLANLSRNAVVADRAGFSREIDGLVRHDRHDALFDQVVRCVAELSALRKRT